MKKIKYQVPGYITTVSKNGESVETEILSMVTTNFSTENEEIAKREAYNGEYTIEDDGEPDPITPESDTVTWDELDAAYREGVDSL